MREPTEHVDILAVVSDLLFASKITATARAFGVRVRVVSGLPADALPQVIQQAAPRLVLVDLNAPAVDMAGIAAAARGLEPSAHTLGFVSHVDQATAQRALEAGIVEVMPRSRFHACLEAVVLAYASPPPTS